VFDRPARLVHKTSLYLAPLRSEIYHLRFRKQRHRLWDCSRSIQRFRLLAFYQLRSFGLLCRNVVARANAELGSSSSILRSSAITPPLSFPQSLVPAPDPQTESGSESSPFSDLLYLLHFSQPGEQSHAQTGSSPRPGDGRQKCRPHVDRNRTLDSHEFSSKK